MIAGCYRRDEAQDPEIFAAALASVLSTYPRFVVEYIADPRTGVIKEFPNGLPNVGQIQEFCDHVQKRKEALRKEPLGRRLPRPYLRITEPGGRANLFYGVDSPGYAEACAWAEKADLLDWRYGECTNRDGEARRGIFVAPYWRGDRPNNQVAR